MTTAETFDSIRVEPSADSVLSASDVTVRFGGLAACSNIAIDVPRSAFVGLVGPNGAGKSTLFSVLSGLRRPNTGRVVLTGQDVTNASPQARARLGLARTFQQPELFIGLTVRDHLVLAYRARHQPGRLWQDLFTMGSLRRPGQAERDRVDRLLELLLLTDVAYQYADSLPLGTSRLVEVGRALATSPTVMLLDEPLSGLDVHEAERLALALKGTVEEEGVAILMVEHDVAMVLRLCSRIFVLDFGELIAAGAPEEIRTDPRVRAAYLGDGEASDGSPSAAESPEGAS